jgi:hypothetical protein
VDVEPSNPRSTLISMPNGVGVETMAAQSGIDWHSK